MLFSSFEFIFIFLPIVFVFYFTLNKYGKIKMAIGLLALASLVFYSVWYPPYLLIILLSIGTNYFLGHLILKKENPAKKRLLIMGIIFNILLLGVFKYTDFFIQNYNMVLDKNTALLDIALPLAISFFTFQQISYIVDLYRGQVKTNNFYSYVLFVSFFPQLIAGPIVHHSEMMPQFEDKLKKSIIPLNVAKGLFIFSIGLAKKVVIADTFAVWANDGYSNYTALSSLEAWITSLSYTFQLYYDFSGYCDMAIGAALLFNIALPVNFNSPYKARNIGDFWRRWHMTLNVFLTQYLYIPLGGNRKGKVRTYINIFLIFLISGIWHGAGWTFIVWGVLHGIASMVVKFWSRTKVKLPYLFSWALTFLFVHFAWVYFRAETMDQANVIIVKMLSFDTEGARGFFLGLSENFVTAETLNFIGITLANPLFIAGTLLFGFIIAVFFKNSIEFTEEWKPDLLHLVHMQSLIIAVLLVLFFFQKSSEFLYFNF